MNPSRSTKWSLACLDPGMIEDTARLVNEAVKDKVQVNLIINDCAGCKRKVNLSSY